MKKIRLLALTSLLFVLLASLSSCLDIVFKSEASTTSGIEQEEQSPKAEELVLPNLALWLEQNEAYINKISIEDSFEGSCVGASAEIEEPYYIGEMLKLLSSLKLTKATAEEVDSDAQANRMVTNVYFYASYSNSPVAHLVWINGYLRGDNGEYYKCEGEFINTDFVTDRFMQALYSTYPETQNGFAGRMISLENKPDYLWVYLVHPMKSGSNMPYEREIVEGFEFEYPEHYRIIVFYHDETHSLSAAYELGVIDKSDLLLIGDQYPKLLAELQRIYDK